MNLQEEKCVMILDENLPAGLIANTAAILGFTLGKALPEAAGRDVADAGGCLHKGIIQIPIPILRADADKLSQLRSALKHPEFSQVVCVDFSDLAQICKTYDEFTEKMSRAQESDLNYLGLALFGPRKKINKLAGSLPLLR